MLSNHAADGTTVALMYKHQVMLNG